MVGVLTRLKAFLEFEPRAPADWWLSSEAYFQQACAGGSPSDRLFYKEWASGGENTRTPARTLHAPHPLFDPDRPFIHGQYPNTFAICVPGGRVIGGRGSVIAPDGKILFDVSIDWSAGGNDAARHPLLRQKRLARSERLGGISTVLATSESARFFHWMTDALPRLEILRNTSPVPWEEIDHFVISEGIPAIRESLSLLGIRDERLVVAGSESHFLCDWLLVPSLPGAPGNVPPWAVSFLKSHLLKAAPRTRTKRIYLSRAKASGRRVINEEEIWPLLSDRGFVNVMLEDLSLADQITLFSEAEAVVGPHGAGFTNLIWCAPDTKVLEFFSPLYVNLCYWAISSLTRADYFYLLGSADGQVDDVNDARFFLENVCVDPVALERTLEAMRLK